MQNKKSKYFNTLFRKAHSKKGIMGKFWKVLYVLYSEYVLGCEIKWYTEIGTGFEIFHGARGSVISPTAIIGKNVSLRQNTTIGSKGFDGADNSPIIEDNVTIGPNVCIIGHVRVGHDCIIGAGAVVVKDVPPNTIVAGNPAVVIKELINKK